VNEKEIKDHIKKLTVQIETPQERGTGVLIEYQKQYYILTVHHVIFGKNSIAHKVESDEIKVIFDNKAEIYIEKIIPKKGLILLEIDNRNLPFQNSVTLLFDNVPYDKKLYIRGFPSKFNQAHNFEAKCNDDAINRESFQIAMRDMTSDTSGDDAIEYMRGVSGSGVFYAKGDRLYLVGLVNALADQAGTFNAIVCTNLYGLGVISSKFHSLRWYQVALPVGVVGLLLLFWNSNSSSNNNNQKIKPITITEKPKIEKPIASKIVILSIKNKNIYDEMSRELTQHGFIISQKEHLLNGYKIDVQDRVKHKSSVVYDNTIIKTNCRLSFTITDLTIKNQVKSDYVDGVASRFNTDDSDRACLESALKKMIEKFREYYKIL